ncbi:MAG TPA: DUF3800 domain-containing protein [Chthonomonadaceae bacterium]|nr:DUF3800 domain-containing protein [Chthonomonadaceae bacterium]
MYLCYVDESGTPEVPGNTSHYILAGLSIPVDEWKQCDLAIETINRRYDLVEHELRIAWIMRHYQDQSKVPDFDSLDWPQRRYEVNRYRNSELLRLQRAGKRAQYQQTRKNYQKTDAYVHLSDSDRRSLVRDVAMALSGCQFARLFAECVDKIHFDPARTKATIDEQAFEQIVSRFEQYVKITNSGQPKRQKCNCKICTAHRPVAGAATTRQPAPARVP